MASSSKLPNLPDASGENLAPPLDGPAAGLDPEPVVEEVKTFVFEVDAGRKPSPETPQSTDGSPPNRPSLATRQRRDASHRRGESSAEPPTTKTSVDEGAPIEAGPAQPTSTQNDASNSASGNVATDATSKPRPRIDPSHGPASSPARVGGPTVATRPEPSTGRPRRAAPATGAKIIPRQKSADKDESAKTESRVGKARTPRRQRPSSPRPRRGRVPSWAVSLIAHGLLLAVLSFATLATFEERPDYGLLASVPVTDEVEQFVDVELDAESLEEFADELTNDLVVPEPQAPTLAADAALSDVVDQVGPGQVGDLGDLAALFDGSGTAQQSLTESIGDAGAATFFGEEIQGRRIVFLVDNSGGMQRGGLEALCSELKQCVRRLTPQQRFFVIFYSDAIYPLFYPDPANQFVRATPRTLAHLDQWLDSVEVCLGNAIDEALAAATAIGPDVVYLLTDGRVNTTRDGRKLNMFLATDGRRFTIHTLGMGTGETGDAAEQLRQIADANGGTFRAVQIEPTHRQAAEEKNRPYHNRGPGLVWGRAVKPPR